MKRKLVWDGIFPVVLLLLTALIWTSLDDVQAQSVDDIPDAGDDMYADEYEDTYEEEDDVAGLAPNVPERVRGDDSDKSSASSPTATMSTTVRPPVIIFSDVDDSSTEREDFACPGECSCSDGTKVLNCSHRGLTAVPANLPANVLRLDLRHNNLKRLSVEAFQNCTGLQTLLLAGNVIEQFDKELLLKFDRLTLLDLASNQLAHLDSDSFSEASKSLRTLHLSDNPIVLPDSGPFLGQPELEQLYLVNCNLTELPEETFSELGGLTLLDLFGNQFDEDMSVDVFEPLTNLIHLRLPSLSENTVRELCDKLHRIDVIDITTHNISCFYLASESSFEESIIVDVPKMHDSVSTTKEPITSRPTRKAQGNLNEIVQDYKSSTPKLQSSDLSLHTTTARSSNPKADGKRNVSEPSATKTSQSQSGNGPSSASITDAGSSSGVDGDSEVIKTATSSAASNQGGDTHQSLLSSITPETMRQLLMAIIGVTVLGLIVGLICRRTGIKNKLCGTKRRPAPTDQVRPAEEVPLNKV